MTEWDKKVAKLSDSGIVILLFASRELKIEVVGEGNMKFVAQATAKLLFPGGQLNFVERERLGRILKLIVYKDMVVADVFLW
jgi:hypothetical protein